MVDGMDTSRADGQSPFQGLLTPDDPGSLQSSEHICERFQQMANEKAAAERALSLHLTYLNDPDIQADPVVLQRIENIVRRTSSKVDFIDDQQGKDSFTQTSHEPHRVCLKSRLQVAELSTLKCWTRHTTWIERIRIE
ncbi:hypothetical protein CEXT_368701 [Caerostris extrusa]|uniref:Uncharacterized protein n=1 Tax=Caerostris extrusa TaxID=172846 RepID=A0AAV4XQR3_CAEEX|nr:hypothetical protein CEXT_368701 [Caerostris extrusa]